MTNKKQPEGTVTAGDSPAPAKKAEASGAVIEDAAAKLVDHPAVDTNPREGTTAQMNQIDFNTPSALQSADEQVEEDLKNG